MYSINMTQSMTIEWPRRRDPDRRRQLIVDAAADLVLELGVDGLTHRRIAERAGVSVGSTTRHFATLDDLRRAAMKRIADDLDQALADTEATLRTLERDDAGRDLPTVLAEGMLDYLSDEHLLRCDVSLSTAALTDTDARSLALRWFEGLVTVLSPYVGRDRATAVATFIDGAVWHSVLEGSPLNHPDVTEIIRTLITKDEHRP
jgi:DNA-binding transcriptional regulator YbjK